MLEGADEEHPPWPLPLSGHGHGRAIRPSSTAMDAAPSHHRMEVPTSRRIEVPASQPLLRVAAVWIRFRAPARREAAAGRRGGGPPPGIARGGRYQGGDPPPCAGEGGGARCRGERRGRWGREALMGKKKRRERKSE
jgi:hypothetical protein